MEDNKLYFTVFTYLFPLDAVSSEDYKMSNEERFENNELQTIL